MSSDADTAPSVAQIRALIDAGKLEQADDACRRRLEVDREHTFALSFLASRAGQRGDYNLAVDLCRRLVEKHPDELTLRQNLGLALEGSGQAREAIEAYSAIIDRKPDSPLAFLFMSRALDAVGCVREAALAAHRGFNLDQSLQQAYQNPSAPAAIRDASLAANQINQAYRHESHRQAALAVSGALSSRFERFLRGYDGLDAIEFADPLQRPSYHYFPEIVAKPWWDAADFPWMARLAEAATTVAGELHALMAGDSGRKPYVEGLTEHAPPAWQQLEHNLDWSSFHILKGGEVVAENAERCPETLALLQSLPLAKADGHAPEAFFSLLKPGTHIPPHHGLANTKLTVHLPLIIPDGCAITVGEETRTWVPGKIMVFDDSYRHEARNRGQSMRAVLITECWNPSLTEQEIDGLAAVIGWDTAFHALATTVSASDLAPDKSA